MNSAHTSEATTIVLNGKRVNFVTHADSSFQNSHEALNILGYGEYGMYPESKVVHSFSLERYLCGEEFTNNLLDTPISGGFRYAEWGSSHKAVTFTNGRLKSYSVGCSIGGIPTCSSEFAIYGDLVQTDNLPYTGEYNAPIEIITNGGISIESEDSAYDNIKSFSLSFDVPRRETYDVFARRAETTDILYPAIVEFSMTIDVDEFNHPDSREFLDNLAIRDSVTITIRGSTGKLVALYQIPTPRLVGVDLVTDLDDALSATLNYRASVNSLSGIVGDMNPMAPFELYGGEV
jgi:hypothetical protein